VLLARSDVEFGVRSGKIVAGIWGGVEMEGLAELLKALPWTGLDSDGLLHA
jgi:hypothetical protein